MANDNNSGTNELKHGAIGGVALVFLVVAAAAPLGASATNTPLIFWLGNGPAAAFDFVIIGILLLLFSVGFTAMSTHITNAGAFYTYISLGLGKKFGTAAGFVAVAAYNLLSVYLVTAGGTFASSIVEQELGLTIPWWLISLIFAAIILTFSYFGIEGGTKFLMVCLVCEITILFIVDGTVLIKEGFGAYPLSVFSFDTLINGGVPGGIGLGVCFAFLSFIGFEATAIFGEETRNPRKTIPRATFAAVILIGIVYSFSAWSVTAATDVSGAAIFGTAEMAEAYIANGGVGAYDPTSISAVATAGYDHLYHDVAEYYCGGLVGHLFNWFLLISNFASWMGAHGMASRYLYAFSRANLLPKAMEKTNKAKSPFVACCVNIALGLGISYIMALCGLDPYSQIGAICSAIAIVGIMAMEIIVNISVIVYMRKHNSEPGFGHNIFATTICPILAFLGLGYILFLLLANFSLLSGYESLAINIFIAGITVIIGIIGYIVAIQKEKKGLLVDPTDIITD